MSDTCVLQLWTIYERPRDYPEGYVVRATQVMTGGACVMAKEASYFPTLVAARRSLPLGLAHTARHPDDDPAIREVWL
jgi:hypothetical protein